LFDLLLGFLNLYSIIAIMLGTIAGLLIGAIPGLGPTLGVALLLPFTYHIPAVPALVLLISLYQAAEYGGSISSILINTPGTPGATATLMDGYPMCRKGQPGKALGYSLTSSTIGGLFGIVVMIFLSKPFAAFAIRFGPPEYFSLCVFGLASVASLSGKSPLKGVMTVIFGLLLTTVGIDVFTSYPRFADNVTYLYDGIPLVPVLVGLFAISELFKIIGDEIHKKVDRTASSFRVWVSFKEMWHVRRAVIVGCLTGILVGILPGVGATPAAWLAYSETKRGSKNPELFGTGCPEGIAAPEAANNAIVGGSLIPLLILGIPGSATAAVILGALLIQGVQPGPDIMTKSPEIVYAVFGGAFISNLCMWWFGITFNGLLARTISLPNWILVPLISAVASAGAYAAQNSMVGVWIMLICGFIGYAFKKFDFPLAPLIVGFVLGGMIESNLRRSLLVSDGSYGIFLSRPISLVLLIMALFILLLPVYRKLRAKRRPQAG